MRARSGFARQRVLNETCRGSSVAKRLRVSDLSVGAGPAVPGTMLSSAALAFFSARLFAIDKVLIFLLETFSLRHEIRHARHVA